MSETPPVPVPTAAAARRRRTVILSSLAGFLAVVVIAATVMVVTMRSDSAGADPQVDLASVSSVGPNPFAALTNATATPVDAVRVDTSLAKPVSGAAQLAGTTPGLYAGGEEGRCDPAALARYLGSDFTRAQGWAGVFGITADQIPYFLNSLTPVTLTADTWVTNHSWEDGVARPFQSVLQAGTPVLVDSEGVPRVRCACGNPLGPPASAPLSGFRTSGVAWPGYQTTRVVHVQTAAPAQASAPGLVQAAAPATLTVRNPSTGDLVQQVFSALLNVASLPPLAKPLPTAASMNVPFRSSDPAVAESNGVTTQGVALPEMTRAAAAATVTETSTSAPESSAPSTVAAAPATSTPPSSMAPAVVEPPAALAAPVAPPVESSAALLPPPVESSAPVAEPAPTSEPPSTSVGPVPTKFTGTGSGITGFTYADTSGSPVQCSVQAVPASTPTEVAPTSTDPSASDTPAPAPETTESTPTDATISCSNGSSTTVSLDSLSQSSVQSATDSQGIWTVSLGGASVPVTEATWG
ncbi:DUF6777 domain-containing protein [uncultured Williamsia sp.]|uniref:DUF6777 domain-containing protein n=1 Tax=uncultured Williamsia sp. TaxID=259311 RepID=UPI0026361B8E|nr:DUF6777 domain-containing protein [uncultured Williamsia sp.]